MQTFIFLDFFLVKAVNIIEKNDIYIHPLIELMEAILLCPNIKI